MQHWNSLTDDERYYKLLNNCTASEMLAIGDDKEADLFLICPTVDTASETNAFDLNDELKSNFIYALDLEKGIYEETGRLFSPYYHQMSINAYNLTETEREKAKQVAYEDISAAFRWYLDHENEGRGIILAGFSQGAFHLYDYMFFFTKPLRLQQACFHPFSY